MRQHIPLVFTVAVQGNRSQTGVDIERTIRDVVGSALRPVRAEMAKELASATADRDAVLRLLETAKSTPERAALNQRLDKANATVDKLQAGINKLDADLPGIVKVRASSAGSLIPPVPPPPMTPDYIPENMIIFIVAIIFVGFPLAIAAARIAWKRASHAPAPSTAQLPAESTRRFDQLEHAVDAIAIEVERISENQRYLTKLLSEPRQNVAIGSGKEPPPS